MQKRNPHMSSLEAAALIMSEGATTDVEQAGMMQDGKLLDPDRLERAHFRRALGFDFTVLHDEQARKWIIRDEETGLKVTAPLANLPDPEKESVENANRLAKACMKLKVLHDKYLAAHEAETDE